MPSCEWCKSEMPTDEHGAPRWPYCTACVESAEIELDSDGAACSRGNEC